MTLREARERYDACGRAACLLCANGFPSVDKNRGILHVGDDDLPLTLWPEMNVREIGERTVGDERRTVAVVMNTCG